MTFHAQFLNDGLQVEHQLGIIADILPHLIHEEKQTIASGFGGNVLIDFAGQFVNADLHGLFAVEPVAGGALAYPSHFCQCPNNIIFPEGKGLTAFVPRFTVDFLKAGFECGQLTLLVEETFECSYFHVIAVVAAFLIEHLCEYAQDHIICFPHRGF